jgi:nucleoside 2-deoxyribosyltransferase
LSAITPYASRICGILGAMKIYFAGPDIFRPDVLEWAREVHILAAAHGHEALLPFEQEHATPEDIFRANIELLRSADAVIANLNPFRGIEPDSGTCVEVGYALALGKPVVAYIAQDKTLAERIAGQQGAALNDTNGQPRDRRGLAVENFGLPLNLMLAIPVKIVVGGIPECLAEVDKQQS